MNVSPFEFSRRAAALGSAALLAAGLLLGSCQQDGADELDGPAPTAAFTTQFNTTQYPVEVTFTSTSASGFLEQWNFGDGSSLETHPAGEVVKHTYTKAGTYDVILTVAGRGGTTLATQTVNIGSLCGNLNFAAFTDCNGNGGTWRFSPQPGAIKRLSASGAVLSESAAPLPPCQADDQFAFSSNYVYSYDAKGGTYANNNCGPARTTKTEFSFKPGAGVNGLGQITLRGKGAFIGLPDSVSNKTYDVVLATTTLLRLRGTNPDGTRTEVTLVPQLSDLELTKLLLTGGSSRTWMLDNRLAAAITVGENDAAPTGYYGGGVAGSLPPCQADDEFTFTSANEYIYDAKGQTFVAGGVGCQAPRSGSSAFTVSTPTSTGILQFELVRPGAFIGITDAPDPTYRILSINDTSMVLRAGRNKATGTGGLVFTMKLRVK